MANEISNNEILEAIHSFSTEVDKRFNNLEKDVNSLTKDVNYLKSQMVTKDYLDDKLIDLKGDLVVLMRKEDAKVKRLVEILTKKNILTEKDAQEIIAMEPFAKISL